MARNAWAGLPLETFAHFDSNPQPAMNTDQIDNLASQLKQSAQRIAQEGHEVRAGISRLVSDAAGRISQAKDGFTTLVRAVGEGAAAGASSALPDQTESVLRSVIDGLADGLGRSAHAIKLTLEESGASGVHFAQDDLNKVMRDFQAIGESFTEIFSDAVNRLGGEASGQARAFVDHARQTWQTTRPALQAAVDEALKHPAQLGRETVQAGTSAARQAAGVLFSELGRRLQGTGGKPNS